MRKSTPTARGQKLKRVSQICIAMPEAVCQLSGSHATFRVRGKPFAYFLDNHHGDGIMSVCFKTAMAENVDWVSREPERCYLPAYIGARGWLGVRLDRGPVNWRELQNLAELSYGLIAPKTLVARLTNATG